MIDDSELSLLIEAMRNDAKSLTLRLHNGNRDCICKDGFKCLYHKYISDELERLEKQATGLLMYIERESIDLTLVRLYTKEK